MAASRKNVTVILTCEHSVNFAPQEARRILNLDKELLASHRGFDAGMRESVERLSTLLRKHRVEAHTFHSKVTRLVLDYNRNISHKKQLKNVNQLSEALRKKILVDYTQYRTSVEKRIRVALKKNHRVVVLSMHSFTPIFKGHRRRTDIGLLFDFRELKERKFATEFRNALREVSSSSPSHNKLNIDFNLPYRGHTDSFSVDLNEKFRKHKNYECLFIEYNQKHLKEFKKFDAMIAECIQAIRNQ